MLSDDLHLCADICMAGKLSMVFLCCLLGSTLGYGHVLGQVPLLQQIFHSVSIEYALTNLVTNVFLVAFI